MGWGLLVVFCIGVVLAVRIPILHFTIVTVIGMVVYAVSSAVWGAGAEATLVWTVSYAVALEAGYVFTHCILYIVYVKIGGRSRKKPLPVMRSTFSRD